jgi:hypothetical protein
MESLINEQLKTKSKEREAEEIQYRPKKEQQNQSDCRKKNEILSRLLPGDLEDLFLGVVSPSTPSRILACDSESTGESRVHLPFSLASLHDSFQQIVQER